MDLNKLDIITHCFSKQRDIDVIKPFEHIDHKIVGSIALKIDGDNLNFSIDILPCYPFQFRGTESIKFINYDMIQYNHVMSDGSICIHTSHSPILERKIELDLNSLRAWVKKYYIDHDQDMHYEHIVVPSISINGVKRAFLFTDGPSIFRKGMFGTFSYSAISQGVVNNDLIYTYIIQDFIVEKQKISCNWNSYYKSLTQEKGIFYFSEKPPTKNRRFAVLNWLEIEEFVTEGFSKFLYDTLKNSPKRNIQKRQLPFLFGYNISKEDVHWEAIIIDLNTIPNYGEKIGPKTYIGKYNDQVINWAITKNSSYKYFFGRGTFSKKITESNILVIGIGAVGSNISTTLVRGGLKKICLVDYDIKEPENVCRSEYHFMTGLNDKIHELKNLLLSISPFIEIKTSDKLFDIAKMAVGDESWKKDLEKVFDDYDIIFDCSTDNDVAFILNQLEVKGEIFNISLTNYANELVCVTKPNIYKWLMEIFDKLSNNTDDLYNPIGCWSPTFKASYNDISVLVQFALKHINNQYDNNLIVRNFYLSSSTEHGFNIKLNQFLKFINKEKNLLISVEDKLVQNLVNLGLQHYPQEFGGVLVGHYSKDLKVVHIKETILPKEYSSSKDGFYRGAEGLKEILEVFYLQSPRLLYIGEWHTHPNGPIIPSLTDLNALREIQEHEDVYIKNPILLIIGIFKEAYELGFYVPFKNRIYKYDVL